MREMVSPWRIIGQLFGEVLDRSGLKDSIASQCQRIACVWTKGEVPPPASGTPLVVDLFGVVEHSGIYLGNGRVAELFGDNLLREVTLREFLEGEKGAHVRTGRRIFAACSRSSGKSLASLYASENARAYIRRIRTVEYDLFRNNCHLFSISCISGNFQKGISLADGIRRGGISIGVLTHAISYFLNDGNDVIWKAVAGWDRKTLKMRPFDDSPEECECRDALQSRIAELTNDKAKCAIDGAKLDATLQKASVRRGLFAPCREYVKLAYEAVRDCISGKRRDVPWSTVCWIAASLLYFISPVDLIPDPVPIFGYADDAAIFLHAFWSLLPYIDIPLELVRSALNVDPSISQWIKGLGEAGGKLASEVQEPEVKRTFDISASLLEYYGRRFGMTLPFALETMAKTTPVVSTWKDWPDCNAHHWQLQVSKIGLGARICDPHGCVCCWGRKSRMLRFYKQFVAWYDRELMPRITEERV